MAVITVAGTALDCQSGGEGEPIAIGDNSRAYAGNERNGVRGQKRTFQVVTIPYVEATWITIRAAIALRAHITVSGTVLSGSSLTMWCRGTAVMDSLGRWVMSLAGEEV